MEQNSSTYSVADMRFVLTEGKVKDKNPDRLGTVHGIFRATNDKGEPVGDPLTFKSKEITLSDARNPLTVVDVPNGILTLPAGERGRKALVGIGQDAITALLAAAREASEPEAEAEAAGEAQAAPAADAVAESPKQK